MLEEKNNTCFIHVATIGKYQEIFDEIVSYIDFNFFKNVYVNVAGEGNLILNDRIVELYPRCDLEDYEFSTLNLIKDFSENNPNSNICYIHTKGASSGDNICIDEWRQYMLSFNLSNISNIENILKDYDACGVDLVDEPVKHYSGNFWWSTSKHINKLPYPKELPIVLSERHKCEFWVTSHIKGKYKSLHNSNINVYQRHLSRYPKEKYMKNTKNTSINFIIHERYDYISHSIKELLKLKDSIKDKILVNILASSEFSSFKKMVDDLKSANIKVNAFKITGDDNYMRKILTAIENGEEYSISIDEDVFIPYKTWEYFIENVSILDDSENLFLSPTITSGIPSVDLFVENFLNEDERNKLENIYLETHIPNIWGCNYERLNDHTINSKKWNCDAFYDEVRNVDHYYKGVHPVRFSRKAQNYLNDICIGKLKEISNIDNFSLIKIKRPYFCNSVFAIKTETWENILNDQRLIKDGFDEVPMNLYMQEKNLNMVFIKNGVAFHPSYNTINVFGHNYEELSNNFFNNEFFK